MENTFHKTALATGVAIALGVTTSPAIAQNDEPIEEIITTGIRGSLMQSMDLKRSADGVVDAITAEDMGDFPDTNLAESLQRITGVSIDRERGEGARVTVRGFGPQFNLVTLNGRQMPTTGDNRNFDFGDLASEAVSAVEIYKTGRADVPTGGIGSTINIRTTRPLEAPGLNISAAASGVYDQSRTARKSTGWTGEISGIISNTFADDRVGVALTVVRQERESGGANATVGGWRSFDGAQHISWGAAQGNCDSGDAPADITPYVGQEAWGGLPIPCFAWEGANQNVNRPVPGEIYSVPQTIGYRLEDYDRVRTNGQLTLQFRPVETVTATLDYMYADLELDRTYNDLSAWFNFGGQQTVWPSEGSNLTPDTYREFSSGSDYSMGAGEDAFKNEDRSVGFNLMWDIGDRFTLEFDYHDSKATNEPNSEWGSTALLSMAAYTRDVTTGYFEGQELPILELGLSNPLTPDDMQITGSVFQVLQSEMDIDQARLSGAFELDTGFIESIDFGVQLTDTDYESQFSNVQRDAWFANTPIGALSDLLTPASMAGSFDQIDGSGDPRRQLDYFLWDMAEMIGRANELIASGDMDIFVPGNGDLGPCGTALCPTFTNWTTNRATTEETQSAYIQVNASTEWGDFPVDMRLGLRYEQTDVTSRAEVPAYNTIVWVGGNELVPTTAGESQFTSLEGDYDYLLPNFDIAIDFTDELVARFSYSETLTRPNYVDIQGGVTIDSPVRIDSGTGSRGNPALLPFESDNIDFSVEYYYGDASYASVGYFRKDVKNFIGRDTVAETVFELPHPGLGPLADEARQAGVGPNDILNWILTNRPDEPGVDADAGTVTGIANRDPSAVFDLNIPVNIDKATVDGWELNIQHDFWESGFGVIVNATFVSGDVGYDDDNIGAQFAISGLSDSANFIGYYENDTLGVRLAYNWRDTFWAGNGQANVGGDHPTYVDEYGQWDLNANYWFNDNLQFFADVINITDETAYVFGRQKDQPLFAVQQGTRYNIGVRYKF